MSLKVLKWLLAAVVITFALATAYVAILTSSRQAALQKISRFEVAWSVGQSVNEFMRLEHGLAASAVPGSKLSLDEAKLRLDIMFSRLQTFEGSGSLSEPQRSLRLFIESRPEHEQTIRALRAALEAVDPILAADRLDGTQVLAALDILRPLDGQLTALSSAAMEYSAARVAEDQRELQDLSTLSSGLAAVFVACGVILIGLLVVHNGLLGRAHAKLRTLAEQLTTALAELRTQNTRFDAALNNMPQALCMVDGRGKLAVFNERFAQITGLEGRLQVGVDLADLAGASSPAFQHVFAEQRALLRSDRTETAVCDYGDEQSFALIHAPLPEGGWLATYEDITERRRAAARIAHLAHHDTLTDLPNRALFNEQLSAALADARSTQQHLALILLDLDNFKDVNDSLGHNAGDELLQGVAGRLLACVEDQLRISRIGGDEFAVFTKLAPAHDPLEFCDWLIGQLSLPFEVHGHEIRVRASAGVVDTAGADGTTPQELFRRADLALYKAKADGRGCTRRYEAVLDEVLQQRKKLELDLVHALDRCEMTVYYQPIVDLATQRACSYEALLRWRHPELGWVSPATFIPVAEQTGAIFQLGEWVLQQACAEAATWQSLAGIAVNLSAVQLRDPFLVERLTAILRRTQLEPSRLELEITESVLLEASETTLASLKRIKALGVRIAMDDFGTGYSSLGSLSSFPFDKIKIDRAFVVDLPGSANARAVVELIIKLGRQLGMRTTAEGVETAEQLHCLESLSCSEVQGYLFEQPRLIDELAPMLRPVRDTRVEEERLSA